MSAQSLVRMELARKIAPAYAANPNVQCVLTGGSVVHGWADDFSDVELTICCASPPGDAERHAAAEAAGGTKCRFGGFNPQKWTWPEEYEVDGIKIDVAWNTVADIEAIVSDVIERFELNFNKQMYLSIIRHAEVFHGAELMRTWRGKIARYPDELALAMVASHLQFQPFCLREILAARDDIPLLYENHCVTIRRIFATLLGLNRIYYPGFKWTRHFVAGMKLAPANFAARLETVFHAEAVPGARELRALVMETFTLVDEHLPAVNVAARREEFERTDFSWIE